VGVVSRPVILLDVDGVLGDFVGETIHGTRQRLSAMGLAAVANRLPDATDRWDIKGCLVDAAPDHADDIRVAVNATWRAPGLAASLSDYPGAVDGVGALRAFADVVALTAPLRSNATWGSEREEWLRRHFGFAGADVDIIITGAKWRIPGAVLVEDRPETLAAWMEAWPQGVGVLIDRPYNRDARGPWVRVPCGDWPHIARVAQRSAEEILR
jgi:5'(3')-deoxyribonucleotidase